MNTIVVIALGVLLLIVLAFVFLRINVPDLGGSENPHKDCQIFCQQAGNFDPTLIADLPFCINNCDVPCLKQW